MKYKETLTDLSKRIESHDKYGTKNIDEWMLDILRLKNGMKILDVGCGSGKQCKLLRENSLGSEVTGTDINKKLFPKMKGIKFKQMDFNKRFGFEDNQFDLVTCCFALYYAKNHLFTLQEMMRVLRPGGLLFVSVPMQDNKEEFYSIINSVTDKVFLPYSRFSWDIYETIKTLGNTNFSIFRNPVVFPDKEPFLEYVRASLSEDRELWNHIVKDLDGLIERLRGKITGSFTMTKVVGGFTCLKEKE